jgi:hypothetical protein
MGLSMATRKKSLVLPLQINKRRTLLRASLLCPFSAWLTTAKALPVRLPPVMVNGVRTTFSTPQISVPPGAPAPRVSAAQPPFAPINFGKFVLLNGERILRATEEGNWVAVMQEFYNAIAMPTTLISTITDQLRTYKLFSHWLATGGYANQPFADENRFAYGHTQGMTALMGLLTRGLCRIRHCPLFKFGRHMDRL